MPVESLTVCRACRPLRPGGARHGMPIINTVFRPAGCRFDMVEDSYPNEPYARLLRADSIPAERPRDRRSRS